MAYLSRRSVCTLWLAVFLSLTATCASGAQPPGRSLTCKECHAAVWQDFFRNPHFRPTPGDENSYASCETCHGPSARHITAHGGKATIRAFSEMQPQQVLAACLECHSKDISRANIRSSEHTLAGVVCTNCHSVHRSTGGRFLLARRESELCYTCHQTVRAQFQMPDHHRVDEGAITCSDCHNPHGAFASAWRMGSGSHMLKAAFNTDEPCLGCHVDKRGPFVFEHGSVRVEGCMACHFPHGSTNSRLLRRPVVFTLCLECHNGAGAFGRENSGVFMTTSTHNLLDPRYQRCTLCHVRIHGSNSDPTFLR
jgi:DmsE family decaheme c-type cytochrome